MQRLTEVWLNNSYPRKMSSLMTSFCIRKDNDENYVLRGFEEQDRREISWPNREEATEW